MIRRKILVIDDELTVLESMAELLEFFGFDAIAALNTETAMEILTGIKVDLILLDFMMPEMNGIRFAQHLLQLKLEIPVIIYSGAEIQQSINFPNVKKIIRKPASPLFVIDAIHDAIKETKLAQSKPETKTRRIGKDG